VGQRHAAEHDTARLHWHQPKRRAHKTRLPGSGFTDYGYCFACSYCHIDVANRLQCSAILLCVAHTRLANLENLFAVTAGGNIHPVKSRRCLEESPGMFVLWVRENIPRRTLLNKLTTLNDEHALAVPGNDAQVMRNKQ